MHSLNMIPRFAKLMLLALTSLGLQACSQLQPLVVPPPMPTVNVEQFPDYKQQYEAVSKALDKQSQLQEMRLQELSKQARGSRP